MPDGQRPNPPPHVAHFTVGGDIAGGAPWANTFWMRNGNASQPTADDFQQATLDFVLKYLTNFKPLLSQDVRILLGTGLYYGAVGGELGAEVGVNETGTSNTGSLPANVSLAIGWRVTQRYRGGHPRTYLAGIPVSKYHDARTFNADYPVAAAQAANNFMDDVNGIHRGEFNSLRLGTVSFVNRKQWRNPPLFRDYVVGSAHADNRIDSMRRRLGHDVPP